MEQVTPRPEGAGDVRADAVGAALQLLDTEGVDGLSMRALADRLGIKAASLYWHFRDREELLDAMSEEVLRSVELAAAAPWREAISAACGHLSEELVAHPARGQLLLRTVPTVQRSPLVRAIARRLTSEGAADGDAAALALVINVAAASSSGARQTAQPPMDRPLRLEIEAGSWRARVRAGSITMSEAAQPVGAGAPSVETRDDGSVIVRSWHGGGRGALELNPRYTWFVKVHSGAWNVDLDLSGLRLGGVEFDSGTGNIECTLPRASGIVPVTVNSGIVKVSLHRPARAPAHATVHGGSIRVRLDGRAIRVTGSNVEWSSEDAHDARDRYDLTVHSGCVRVSLDDTAPSSDMPAFASAPAAVVLPPANPRAAVEMLLDGIAAQLNAGR